MSRIIRAALALSTAAVVLAGTATAVQADGSDDTRKSAEAAQEAARAVVAARQEIMSRSAMPQTAIQLIASHSGKCLDVEGGKATDGVPVQQSACTTTNAQKWTAVATARGTFELRSAVSGKCLEVENTGTKSGAVIQQWACVGKEHQRWQLMLVDPVRKLYELQPAHVDGMCLDVTGGKKDNGVNTQLFTCNRTGAQLWQVQPAK
ncbi:RICIN domain-containing protein [Streptomyces sp. NPDC047014]|uniref:RICIN domain-containing protein n=1 Tax=Streptomyces sp. NPDC047014 TaxID=3155736 RepID=UPI0033F8A3BF